MPKQRITKEMVVQAAFEIAREKGLDNVLVKDIAARLGCSVQPVYCYCRNMDGLRQEVVAYTGNYLREYLREHMDPRDLFRSIGSAHARFASEEPQLYRLYFLRKRENIHSIEEIFKEDTDPKAAEAVARQFSVSLEEARELHLNMMIYNVGISFILSVMGKETDIAAMDRLRENALKAFLGQLKKQEEKV